MFDILFLGKLFPKEIEKEVKSKMKTGMQDAANALQWNIIEGLDLNNCGTIKILDYLPVDSYPKGYGDAVIEEYLFQHSDKYISDDKVVRCNNITIIKQFVNFFAFKKEIKKWINNKAGRQKLIISYTASSMFLSLIKYAKKLDNSVIASCIIADLPEFVSARKLHGVAKIYNAYLSKKSALLYKYVDNFILLTEQMADRLNIKVPYLVIEGIASDNNNNKNNACFMHFDFLLSKYIFYSGTLNYSFGIEVLLEAFKYITNSEVKLVICGTGDAEVLIRKRQDEDKRIIFLGKMDRKFVLELQKRATVLVNPRQNNQEFTKYSFPSKIFEYLSAGVPVVAYKLDGVPDEYDKYLTYPKDNTPSELANCIGNFINMNKEERALIGKMGKIFVYTEKNKQIQTNKILNFFYRYIQYKNKER